MQRFLDNLPVSAHRTLCPALQDHRFPDRRIAYVLYELQAGRWERCILEVIKAVEAHPRGEEPGRLEIWFTN